MKIVHFADVHASEQRSQEFDVMLKSFVEDVKKRCDPKDTVIVFCGDWGIYRDKLSPNQVKMLRNLIKNPKIGFGEYKCIIIPGNHDISNSSQNIDSLSAIFTHDSKINVYTEIGSYCDIEDYRFHMFPYPSRSELDRLKCKDVGKVRELDLLSLFKMDSNKKNVLLFHGTMAGFVMSGEYVASEETIAIGKDLCIPESFYSKFLFTMGGHLHQYQFKTNAGYCGALFPLTFADSFPTGYILWENDKAKFIELHQQYPFITIDVKNLSDYDKAVTEEAVKRLQNDYNYTNARIRITYKIHASQSGYMDHGKIAGMFRGAKDVKILPNYINQTRKKANIEELSSKTIFDLICLYIDKHKYSPEVKDIAKKIEEKIIEEEPNEDSRGIHFRVRKLRLSNFKCFDDRPKEIDFDKMGSVVGVFGTNFSGKSSLVEAICWGLFGSTPRNKQVDSVIRNGQETAVVEIEFNSYNEEYKIVRERGKKSSLYFYLRNDESQDWVDVSSGTAIQTQKHINRITGTYEMFISTVYSPQNKFDILVEQKPNERKQLILDCLQISVLEKRAKIVAEARKKVRDTIFIRKGTLDAYNDQLTTLLAKNPSFSIKEFEEKVKNDRQEETRLSFHMAKMVHKVQEYQDLEYEQEVLTNEIVELREKIQQYEYDIMQRRDERNKFMTILADSSVIDEGLARVRHFDEQIEHMDKQRLQVVDRKREIANFETKIEILKQSYKDKIEVLEASRRSAVNTINGTDSIDCSRPDCPVIEKIAKHKADLVIEIEDLDAQIESSRVAHSEEINKINEEILIAEKKVEETGFDQGEYNKYMRSKKEEQAHHWDKMRHQLDSADDIVKAKDEAIASYLIAQSGLKDRRDMLSSKRTEIATKLSSVDRYNKEVERYQIEIEEVRKRLKFNDTQIFNAKRDLEQIESLQKQVIEVKDRINTLELYHLNCSKYAEIVSKHGVLYSFVDNALPVIEEFAKDLLETTTKGAMTISMDSYKLLAAGEQADEVKIWFNDSKGKRDIAETSGAEKMLVSLVLRASISHLLSLRMGSNVELFIVDEGFGSLDTERVFEIKELIHNLGVKFKKVLFITHVEELKDIANDIIRVNTDNLVSWFDITGGIDV